MGKETGGQALAWEGFATNLEIAEDAKHVYVRMEKGKEFGDSKSGKTVILATTQGNKRHETSDGKEIIFGVNVYRKNKDKKS